MKHRTRSSKRLNTAVYFEKVGRTKSEFKDSCDINHILKKYQQTGVINSMRSSPLYGDFSSAPDYQTAQNLIIHANQQFDSLPSDLRQRFANDPKIFLAFTQDPDNHDEMVRLGLLPDSSPSSPDPSPPDSSPPPDSLPDPSPPDSSPPSDSSPPPFSPSS